MPSTRISGARCANTGSRKRWSCVITITIVRFSLLPFFLFPKIESTHRVVSSNKLTNPSTRSHRQRIRTLQVRRLRAEGMRCAQLALVRRAAHLLRAQPRDRFPGGVLSAEQWGRVRARRLLQLHSPQGAERGAGAGVGVGHEEVVESQGQG